MRSQVVLAVVAAVLGGGVTAAALLATGAVSTGSQLSMFQPAAPLLTSGPVGGTTAGNVYRSTAPGVVGVTARSVPVSASAFDLSSRRPDGMLSGSGLVPARSVPLSASPFALPPRRPDGMLSGSGFVPDDQGHIATAAHLEGGGRH